MKQIRTRTVAVATAASLLVLVAAVVAVFWRGTTARPGPLPVPSGEPQVAPCADPCAYGLDRHD